MSKKFLEQPMSAMETACFWIEYIGRHGSEALRSPTLDLAWWQVDLLDVYLTILVICVLFIIVLIVIIRFLIKFVLKFTKNRQNLV